jgi:F-type H+-transporting ATPase subunit b
VYNLTQFAAETEVTEGNIFTSLGIDWQMLILQIVAFLILVVILGKFVYPWLIKSVDERQDKINAANKAAAEAQAAAADAEHRVEKLLKKARDQATEIVDTAKLESAAIVASSEKKARTSAEQIVASAHEQIDKDVANVKKELYNDTLELVGLATGKVIGAKHSRDIDQDLIIKAVKESK